jgi:hypothetical protein
LAAIAGASAATRERRANIAGEHQVEVLDLQLLRSVPGVVPGIVDQHVDVAQVQGQALDVSGVVEVRPDKPGLTPRSSDLVNRVGAARGVSSNRVATARPMPEVAPVTSAVRG